MFKLLFGIVGLLEVLYPERFVDVLTKYSYEYDGEAPTAKPWLVSAARIEGLVILGTVVYSALKADCSCSMLCGSDETTERVEHQENAQNDVGSVDRVE